VVFNEISLLTGFYWLELCKYKRYFRLNLETGMGKNRLGKRKHANSAEFRAGSLELLDGQSDVLVLNFCVGFEGASSGSVGLVAFRLFFVVNLRWPGMRAVCVAVREDWAGLLLPGGLRRKERCCYSYKDLTSKIPLTTRSR
jgi:hypothetical protein